MDFDLTVATNSIEPDPAESVVRAIAFGAVRKNAISKIAKAQDICDLMDSARRDRFLPFWIGSKGHAIVCLFIDRGLHVVNY